MARGFAVTSMEATAMSLILEALRRSEAERRRTSPPTLLGDNAPPPRAAAAWPIALGGLGAGLLLAAAAWWWDSARDRPTTAAAPAWPSANGGAAADAEPIPVAAYAPPDRPSLAIAPPPAAPARTPPARAAGTAAPPASEPRPQAPDPPMRPMDGATPVDGTGTGPRHGDLPWMASNAEGLPALKVSMHVYAEDPARRFAIIDGQRRREGEALGPDLALLEIRRDGLRLRWQGRVLWVPR